MISTFQTVVWCCGRVQSLNDVILKIENTLKTHTTTQKRTNNGLRNTKKPQCITRESCPALAMKSRFLHFLLSSTLVRGVRVLNSVRKSGYCHTFPPVTNLVSFFTQFCTGTPNDAFPLNTLKTPFKLLRVLIDIQK